MFIDNSNASQKKMFTLEDELDERLKKKLKKHWSELFFAKIFIRIDESVFSPLYCLNNGRPNFPVNILVGLEILKEMYNLTDEQLFERYHFDFAFRRALGLTDFNEHILGEKTLYNFRGAVAEYNKDNQCDLMEPVFQILRDDLIAELGTKTGTQRIDSTLIGANIKKMSRLMLFHKVLSNLARDIKVCNKFIPDEIEDVLGEDEDRFTYRLQRDKYEEATVRLGGYIHNLVCMYEDDAMINVQTSYQDAVRLLEEQCRVDRDKHRVDLKNPKEISSSSMQNPADGDAAYRRKNNKECRGYSVHAAETCDKDNAVQLVLDVDVVKSNVDDAAVLAGTVEEYKQETGLETMVADGGYVSDDVREACVKNNVEIITTAIRGKQPEANSEKLSSKDFTCDKESGEIIACPVGIKPRSVSVNEIASIANFDPGICVLCEKRSLCPAYISEKQSRYVIDDNRRWLDDRAERVKTTEYQKLCALRPPVEGLMSQFKPKYLNGRIKFRGLVKVKNRMIMRAIGINFKRYRAYKLDNFLRQLYRNILNAVFGYAQQIS